MKSIQRRFDTITSKNPYWSTYICFAESIKNQNFNKEIIQIWFNKLIDKNDYSKKDKKSIINYLLVVNNSKT